MSILTAKDKAEMAERAKVRKEINAEIARESIQIQALVKVLQDHALGKGRTKMTAAKLKSIEMLLDKSLPDLASVKHEVEARSVVFNLTTFFTPKKKEPEKVERVDG